MKLFSADSLFVEDVSDPLVCATSLVLPFDEELSGVEEIVPKGIRVLKQPEYLSKIKALDIANQYPNDTVIGAGSVVTKDIPDGCVAFGNPCKVHRSVSDHDKEYFYKDEKIDWETLED